MPVRTNHTQRVVAILEELELPPGWVLEEPGVLLDARTGTKREVDIVISHPAMRPPAIRSVEVVALGRKATVEWVDQMIGKHRNLPTEHLFLVSWSAFSAEALASVAVEPGVTAMYVESGEDSPTITLQFDMITATPRQFAFEIDPPVVPVSDGTIMCDADGNDEGTANSFCKLLMTNPGVLRKLLDQAKQVQDAGQRVNAFQLRKPLTDYRWHIRRPDGSLVHIDAVQIVGAFEVSRVRMSSVEKRFRDIIFAEGLVDINGVESTAVVTIGRSGQPDTVAIRTPSTKKTVKSQKGPFV
ncbi:MAG TPA: hypothetical protein VIB78_01045 [Acidimicrobiia bacterium]